MLLIKVSAPQIPNSMNQYDNVFHALYRYYFLTLALATHSLLEALFKCKLHDHICAFYVCH